MRLCLLDLVEFTGGRLRLSAMPPREAELAEVRRICLTAEAVQPGDVYWCVGGQPGDRELAYFRGALGVVSGQQGEPWPGRFCLVVDDSWMALEQFVRRLLTQLTARESLAQESFANCTELKDLQLPAGNAIAIFPPTCGRQGERPAGRRCRKTAA